MQRFCNQRAGSVTMRYNIHEACKHAGLNVLRINVWNMCRNLEWVLCAVRGGIAYGGGGEPALLFTLAPQALDMRMFDEDGFHQARHSCGDYAENAIYYLEVCILNEICGNRDELFGTPMGQPFYCQLDLGGYQALIAVLTAED